MPRTCTERFVGGAESPLSLLACLDISPFAVSMVDQAKQTRLVDHQLKTLFGFSRAELIGHLLEMLLPDRIRAAQIFHCQDNATALQAEQVHAYLQVLKTVDIPATKAARLICLAYQFDSAPACFPWHFLGPCCATLEHIGGAKVRLVRS